MENTNKKKANPTGGLPRRDFFKVIGGGLVILFRPWDSFDLLASPVQTQRRTLTKDFNAFLHVDEKGKVTCYTGKIEMGQGPITALRQLLTDELDVAFEDVTMVMGDTDLTPYDEGTWGSTSVRAFGPALRQAAAEARSVLLQMASEQLKVPVNQLVVKNGVISGASKKVSYAQLTGGKKIARKSEGKVSVKDASQFNVIGKPFLHQDAIEKVTGKAIYSGDVKVPGMMHARILRPPSHFAKLKSVDTSEAEKMAGIQLVRDGDFIAVLHENREMADIAIVKIKAEYDFKEMPVNDRNIFDYLLYSAPPGRVVRQQGNIDEGLKMADKIVESEFNNGYVAHAPIEPHVAAGKMDGDKLTVWVSNQTPFLSQEAIAQAMKMPLEKIRVITPFVGGGFGGKGANPQAVEVARLVKLSGKPVMLAWTREEEFFYDTLRPASVVKIKSGIDKEGKITMWDFHTHFAGSRGSETTYDVPHHRTTNYDKADLHPFTTGPWRAPGANMNIYARELQISIMAAKAGMDQLEFRLKNLKDEKMIALFKAAAEKFGYTPAKGPSRRGIGMACGVDVGTSVASITEVEVDEITGHVQVKRVVCAQDMGLCVNPQGSMIQMEGCITMGMGYALTEEIQFEGGAMRQKNYDTYDIPRFSWVPEIETIIFDKKDQPMRGGGEPAIINMGGSIASAIFDATGAAVFRMPMTPQRVLEAIKKL